MQVELLEVDRDALRFVAHLLVPPPTALAAPIIRG
jgi:hypothetical protein